MPRSTPNGTYPLKLNVVDDQLIAAHTLQIPLTRKNCGAAAVSPLHGSTISVRP